MNVTFFFQDTELIIIIKKKVVISFSDKDILVCFTHLPINIVFSVKYKFRYTALLFLYNIICIVWICVI